MSDIWTSADSQRQLPDNNNTRKSNMKRSFSNFESCLSDDSDDIFGLDTFETDGTRYIVETNGIEGVVVTTLQISRQMMPVRSEDGNNVILNSVSDANFEVSDLDHPQNFYNEEPPKTEPDYRHILPTTNILKEMQDTEQQYIEGLRQLVDEYIPYLIEHNPEDRIKKDIIFKDLEGLYEKAEMFSKSIKDSAKTADSIAEIFIKHESAFESYVTYAKNKPKIDRYLQRFEEIVKQNGRTSLDLANYLNTPFQRLRQYVVLLQTLKRELNKVGKPLQEVNDAISVVQKTMKESDDSLVINSIKGRHLALLLPGALIETSVFSILKPKKVQSTVFLFENAVVFTKKKTLEEFKYLDCILMDELSLVEFTEEPKIFHLSKFKRTPYVLEAQSPEVKDKWMKEIKTKLFEQLEKAKMSVITKHSSAYIAKSFYRTSEDQKSLSTFYV